MPTTSAPIHRRDLLKAAMACGLAGILPLRLFGDDGLLERHHPGRRLIVIELRGGNDGLNTVVPVADPDYYRLRPRLAIPATEALPLAQGLALHPALEPLLPSWQAGELAVALGLGYPQPNRSHFRSWDIWHAASASDEYRSEGWLSMSFRGQALDGRLAHAIALGAAGYGPASGDGLSALVLDNPERFLRQGRRLVSPTSVVADQPAPNPALAHVQGVEAAIAAGSAELARLLQDSTPAVDHFPQTPFGRSCAVIAQLILAGATVPVWIAGLGGFDTHANQLPRHAALLRELAQSLAALREALHAGGQWSQTLICTTSEFGRRVAENASAGTDHGTAAPHLVLGGAVNGGLHGSQPSCATLQRGDLIASQDFRSLLRSAANSWLGLPCPWAGDLPPLHHLLK